MRAAWLLVVALLAGCADADLEPAPAAAPPTATPPDAQGPEPAFTPSPQNGTEGPREVVTSVAWDGRTATALCAASVACRILAEPESSWMEFDALGVPGRPSRVEGVLTWTAASPLTDRMMVFVFGFAPDSPPTDGHETSGPSPLAFDVDVSGRQGPAFAFSIHGHHEAGPLLAETSQAFRLEARIVSLVG